MRLQNRLERLEGSTRYKGVEEYTFIAVNQFTDPDVQQHQYIGAFTDEKDSYVALEKPFPKSEAKALERLQTIWAVEGSV